MLIAIDGYEANVTKRVGIGRYAFEILWGFYRNHAPHRFIIYLPDQPLVDLPPETSWWKYRVVKPKRFWTWLGLPLAIKLTRPKPEVIFSPTHYIPRFTSIPKAMAIMDLSYLKYRELFRAKDLYQLTRWTAYSVKHSQRIFTISEHSKDDIISSYRVPKGKVVVTYPGMNMNKDVKPKAKYSMSKNYILAVGTLQPRKNFQRLIAAFARSYPDLASDYPGLELVIVGKSGWLFAEILSAPKQHGVEKQVKFLDYVAEADLPALYQGALCLVLPSLYEGFGLPVLEAMHYGCPVVVSRSSSLPEIAGEAGIYVDPEDEQSIADGLKQVLAERKSDRINGRIKLGKKLAQKFSWEKAAKQTLVALEQLKK